MNRLVLALFGAALAAPAAAETVMLNYDGFFDRLKIYHKGHYPLARLSFALKAQGGACDFTPIDIFAGGQSYPLLANDQGELLLPYDKALKDDKAVVRFDTEQDCHLAVSVTGRVEGKRVFGGELLAAMATDMAALIDAEGGMMSFLLPKPKGILVMLAEGTQVEKAPHHQMKAGRLYIAQEALTPQAGLRLSQAPLAIRPWFGQ
ncbi:DUF2987 domain-containing protein [Gallaecimonas sp. GXIMD4217]|uniref:DUF2987 domain-containing protein n=1 Tax=Gallaecimonas sp. GXIMD4217 TaxID=3131927 RepID=UPI00311B1D95